MIGRKSYLVIAITLLTSVLNFVALYFMTNYAGKIVYGQIALVYATIGTLNSIADLGFGSAHIKRISEGKDINDCIATYMVIKVFLVGLMVTMTLWALVIWQYVLGENVTGVTLELSLIFMCCYALSGLTSIVTLTFVARAEMARSSLIGLVEPLTRVPLVIIFALQLENAVQISFAYLTSASMLFLVAILYFWRSHLHIGRPNLIRSYASFALPISLISILTVVSANLDKVIIGVFHGELAVASYSSSYALLFTFVVFGTAVASVTFPTFSRMHSEGDVSTVRGTTLEAERYIAMIGLPVAFFSVAFPFLIATTVFGADFRDGGDVIPILAISVLLNMLNQVYLSQIMAFNKPKVSARISLTWFLVDVSLLVLLVPDEIMGISLGGMSFVGAGIANAVAYGVIIVQTRLITRKLSNTVFNRKVLYMAVMAGLSAGALLLLTRYYEPSGWPGLIVYALGMFVLYFALLFLFRLVRKEDVKYILNTLNPLLLFRYARDEVKHR